MILKRGITGFLDRHHSEAMPEFTFVDFKGVVYAVAAPLHLNVTNVTERGITPNFHFANLAGREISVSILGHSIFPICAFAEPAPASLQDIRFVDCPDIARSITDMFPYVATPTAEELNRKQTDSDLRVLGAAERDQIQYWKPQTVGELAFNWWD